MQGGKFVKSEQRSSLPYVFASIGNITILTFLPIFFYCILIFATTDVGGPLNLVLIPCSNLIIAALSTLFFLPLSKMVDRLSQKAHTNWQHRINSPLLFGIVLFLILSFVIGGFTLMIGVILENPFALQVLGEQDIESVIVWLARFLFLGGVPFLLGGPLYWFLLQLSRKMLASRNKSEHPKAG